MIEAHLARVWFPPDQVNHLKRRRNTLLLGISTVHAFQESGRVTEDTGASVCISEREMYRTFAEPHLPRWQASLKGPLATNLHR